MALLHIDFFSRCLMRTVPVTAIIPADAARFDEEVPSCPDKPFKTMYLLHGLYGNNTDWLCMGNVYSAAMERKLAVIMPAAENRWYVDCEASGERYGGFVGEELVKLTRGIFRLSERREDTFIAGLSMGGYGAFRNGIKYGETFGKAASLSGAFITGEIQDADSSDSDITKTRGYYETVFGDLERLSGSDKDCEALYQKKKSEDALLPKLYMACGTEDFLYKENIQTRDILLKNGAPLIYEEGSGEHSFDFWSRYITRVMDWALED